MRTGCWSPTRKCAPLRTSGRKRPLRGTQHNFHDTNKETLNRARPQVVTSRDNRLTDTSEDERHGVMSEHSFARDKCWTDDDKRSEKKRKSRQQITWMIITPKNVELEYNTIWCIGLTFLL